MSEKQDAFTHHSSLITHHRFQMNRENILFAVVGLLFGYIVAFHLVVYVNQNQPVLRTAPGGAQTGLPQDHPPLASNDVKDRQQLKSSADDAVREARQDPKNFDAQIKAGSASLDAGQSEDAIDFFTKANQLRPGDFDGAEATFARLEKINPQNDNLAQLREELDKSRRGADSSTNGDGGKARKKSPTD